MCGARSHEKVQFCIDLSPNGIILARLDHRFVLIENIIFRYFKKKTIRIFSASSILYSNISQAILGKKSSRIFLGMSLTWRNNSEYKLGISNLRNVKDLLPLKSTVSQLGAKALCNRN